MTAMDQFTGLSMSAGPARKAIVALSNLDDLGSGGSSLFRAAPKGMHRKLPVLHTRIQLVNGSGLRKTSEATRLGIFESLVLSARERGFFVCARRKGRVRVEKYRPASTCGRDCTGSTTLMDNSRTVGRGVPCYGGGNFI